MSSLEEKHIDYDCLARYLSKDASPEEIFRVENWLKASEANRKELDTIRLIWHIAPDEPENAAVDVDSAWKNLNSRIQQHKILQQKEEKTNIKPLSLSSWILRIAAVFILGISVWGFYHYNSGEVVQNLIAVTTSDETKSIILPDASQITLNKYSRVEFPEQFSEHERRVKLSGEAHFNVSGNAGHPFIIDANSASVKVIGTIFNVSAYDSLKTIEVDVIEGEVLLYREDNMGYIVDSLQLTKGSKGVYYKIKGTLEEHQADPEVIFWKSRTLVFDRTQLWQVFEVVNRLFETNIAIGEESIRNCRLSATFHNENLGDILEVISSTFGLEIIKTESGYSIKGAGC